MMVVNDVHLNMLISHLWLSTHEHPIPPWRHSMAPFERRDIMEYFIDGLKKKKILRWIPHPRLVVWTLWRTFSETCISPLTFLNNEAEAQREEGSWARSQSKVTSKRKDKHHDSYSLQRFGCGLSLLHRCGIPTTVCMFKYEYREINWGFVCGLWI